MTPKNGSMIGSQTTFPSEVNFRCDEGFFMIGPEKRNCQADGTWSGSATSCAGINVLIRSVVVYFPEFHFWSTCSHASCACPPVSIVGAPVSDQFVLIPKHSYYVDEDKANPAFNAGFASSSSSRATAKF